MYNMMPTIYIFDETEFQCAPDGLLFHFMGESEPRWKFQLDQIILTDGRGISTPLPFFSEKNTSSFENF